MHWNYFLNGLESLRNNIFASKFGIFHDISVFNSNGDPVSSNMKWWSAQMASRLVVANPGGHLIALNYSPNGLESPRKKYFLIFLGLPSMVTLFRLTLLDIRYFLVNLTWGEDWGAPPPGKHTSGTFMISNHLVTHQPHKNGQYYALKVKNPFQLQKKLKNDTKISSFLKFLNDLKNVSSHCGGHYNIKIKHFEHFSVQKREITDVKDTRSHFQFSHFQITLINSCKLISLVFLVLPISAEL